MAVKMPEILRRETIRIASQHGFEPVEKGDGSDIYDKLITLASAKYPSQVKIDKVTGFSKSGSLHYFKVAVHPEHYRPKLEDAIAGILPAINSKTKVNRHSHSGYHGFPIEAGNNEPIARAYKVKDLNALSRLLSGLSGCDHERTQVGDLVSNVENLPVTESQVTQRSGVATAETLPTRGLIIDQPWIDLLLSGEKTWEMRSRSCSIRGRIGLIRKGSGLVVGVAELVDDYGPLGRAELASHRDKHAITPERLPDEAWMDKWNHAWVLTNVRKLEKSIPYDHPPGAVIWVNLDLKIQSDCGAI